MNDRNALALSPPGALTWLVLGLTVFLGPVIIGFMLLFLPGAREQLLTLCLVAGLTAMFGVVLLLVAMRRSVQLENAVLDIRATLYRRRIGLREIELEQARVIDLREHPEYRPWLKTNGFAVPGLAAGHFRDRRKNRVFCLVTGPKTLM
ncbi:MAG: hypothetical protein CVV18_08255, partial [Gammaproteobacteria bacterium HGW-Gammaproteobacteria-8]